MNNAALSKPMNARRFAVRIALALLVALMAAGGATAGEISPPPDATRAEEIYREYLSMLRENPGDAAVNMKLARAAVAAKHPHQAVMAYERALAMSPGDPVILRELADVYDSFGDMDMAALYR